MFHVHACLRSASEGVCVRLLSTAVAEGAADMVREGGAANVIVRIVIAVLGWFVVLLFLIMWEFGSTSKTWSGLVWKETIIDCLELSALEIDDASRFSVLFWPPDFDKSIIFQVVLGRVVGTFSLIKRGACLNIPKMVRAGLGRHRQ